MAKKIGGLIFTEFTVDSSQWKFHDRVNRDFLRTSVRDLLRTKEGLCGEGARVNVRLLLAAGFDATRIVLRTPKLGNSGHTVVSVLLNGQEFLVDTINSPPWFHNLVNNEILNTQCYPIPRYSQRMGKNAYQSAVSSQACTILTSHLPMYDYQAIPYSKLANLIGFDVYVLNLARPSKFISYFAESVYLIWSILFLFIALVIFFIGFVFRHTRIFR